MSFDVSVAHEARWIRITVRGDPKPGRVLSLLQVLEVDSATWPRDAVLLDLRALDAAWSRQDQRRLDGEAAQALRRMRKIAILAPAGWQRPGSRVSVFDQDEAACEWLAG